MGMFWEAGPHRCVKCREQRMGRFCNIIGRGSGWSQHMTSVEFYCWHCYPYGKAVRPREDDPALKPPSAIAAEQEARA